MKKWVIFSFRYLFTTLDTSIVILLASSKLCLPYTKLSYWMGKTVLYESLIVFLGETNDSKFVGKLQELLPIQPTQIKEAKR